MKSTWLWIALLLAGLTIRMAFAANTSDRSAPAISSAEAKAAADAAYGKTLAEQHALKLQFALIFLFIAAWMVLFGLFIRGKHGHSQSGDLPAPRSGSGIASFRGPP